MVPQEFLGVLRGGAEPFWDCGESLTDLLISIGIRGDCWRIVALTIVDTVTFFSDNTIVKFFDSSEILRDYSLTPQITTIITQAVKPFHPKTRVAIFEPQSS